MLITYEAPIEPGVNLKDVIPSVVDIHAGGEIPIKRFTVNRLEAEQLAEVVSEGTGGGLSHAEVMAFIEAGNLEIDDVDVRMEDEEEE